MMPWLAFLAGLWSPVADIAAARRSASRMMRDLSWCWLVSVVLRYAVYTFVAGLLALILWGKP